MSPLSAKLKQKKDMTIDTEKYRILIHLLHNLGSAEASNVIKYDYISICSFLRVLQGLIYIFFSFHTCNFDLFCLKKYQDNSLVASSKPFKFSGTILLEKISLIIPFE